MNKETQAYKVYTKMMQNDFCSQWMGIEPLDIQEGYCRIKMIVKKEMLNGYGILHGGIAYAFADSAFAFASNSYGRIAVSISGSMNFSKSAKEGDILIAEAKALHVAYKTAEFDVNIYQKNSEEISYRFRGTVYRKSDLVLTKSANEN